MDNNILSFASQKAENFLFAITTQTRRKILKLLIENNGSLTLMEIHAKLFPTLTKATISSHLSVLEQAGFIKSNYYSDKHVQRRVTIQIKEFTIKMEV